MSASRSAVRLEEVSSILHKFGLGVPVSITPLDGGASGSFRIDRAVGDALVLKTYNDFIPAVPQREVYASRLLNGLDISITP